MWGGVAECPGPSGVPGRFRRIGDRVSRGRGVCGVPYLDRPATQLAAAWECAGPLVRVPRAVYLSTSEYSPGGLAYGSGQHLS